MIIHKRGVDIMLKELRAGVARDVEWAHLKPDQVLILLESYQVLAAIREHPCFAALVRNLERSMLAQPRDEQADEILRFLIELLMAAPWTPTLIEESTVRKEGDGRVRKLRLVK